MVSRLELTVWDPPVVITHLGAPTDGPRKAPAPARKAEGRRAVEHGHPSQIVRPGTPAWQANAEHGRDLTFELWLQGSLPMLRQHGVVVALDVARPRGTTYLFNLRTKDYHRGPVPGGVVVRELVDSTDPEVEQARLRAEHALGAPARVFLLYPAEMYDALRSYTETMLRQRGVPLASVAKVYVELRLVVGRDFELTLLSHS